MALIKTEGSYNTTYATGGKAGGSTHYSKGNKVVSEKHLPCCMEAPNQFTDQDDDERANQDAQRRRPEQEQQDYTKGKKK